MSPINSNIMAQLIVMGVLLFFFAVFAYVLWLVFRALRKYLKED